MLEIFYRTIYVSLFIVVILPSVYTQSCEVNVYTTADGLPQNNLTHLMFDANDMLWIGTHGGLSVYDGLKFHKVEHRNLSSRIYYIHKDSAENVYICDEKKSFFLTHGLTLINQKNYESFNNWIINDDNYKNFDKEYIHTHIASFLVLHLGYKNFKTLRKNKTTTYINYAKSILDFESFFLLDTTLVGLDKQKRWINFKDEKNQYPITSDLPYDFKKKGFVFNTDNGTFWLYNKTIFKIKLVNSNVTYVPIIKNVSLDPQESRIMCGQFNSKTGFFYFGSAKYGLYEVRPHHFTNRKPKLKNKSDAISSNGQGYYSQSEIDSSTIFINNFIILKDSYELLVPDVKTPCIRCVNIIDNKRWLWYSDAQNIIIQKDKEKKEISLFPISHSIISITKINNENYLLLNSNYIIKINTHKVLKRFFLKDLQFSDSEYGKYIYYNEDKKIVYLLTSKKIYEVNIESNILRLIPSLPLSDYQIMQPLEKNIHFIGTYGQGYLIFDGKKWIQMPIDKKGHLKFAHAALLDDRGHVWISTNNGLFRSRLQDMIDYTQGKSKDIFYYYYDKSSGFLTNEFNGGCQSPAIKLMDGRFSFSSMDGLVQFDPLKVPTSFPLHQPNIIDVKLNNQSQDSVPTSLVITQDIKDIKLEISTTYYGHPDNLQIQYKIPGFVDQWTDLTDQRYINLQNATYGDYIIEIRQRIGFGSHDFEYITYPLVVLPYFYQTWWFIALLSVIGLSLAYIFSRWYSRYMIQKNKELEMLILERNKEVLQTNEVLQEQVKQNDLFQSIFVHDIKSPIRFITSNTALLKTHWNHLDTTIKQDQISHIHDAATKIDHFIEETLLWIKIRNGELQLETNDFQALAMIQKCIDFHKASDKIVHSDIQILADVRQDLYLSQDERLLATIVRNLISNSIKYTAQGKIIVYFLSNPNGSFTMGCKDTGKGMCKSLVEKLLSDHYRGNDIRDDSFKMGYVIIKEIIRLIGGRLHIESEENHGTHVWVEI